MKRIIYLLLIFFSFKSIIAQKPAFLRVYNSQGKKVNKGQLFQTSDTSITLTRRNLFTETPVTQIDVIKSNRTTGHRIVITTLSVVGFAVVLVSALNNTSERQRYNNTSSNKSTGTTTVNPILKTARPLKKYKVNQDPAQWKKQRTVLNLLL